MSEARSKHPLADQILGDDVKFEVTPGMELPVPHSPFFHLDEPGVNASFRVRDDGTGVVATLTLTEQHEGAVGLAHGGILSAIMDHLIGQACMIEGAPAVTRELTVRFLRPTYLRRPIRLEAWVKQIDGRDVDVEGLITQGKPVAEARGHFIIVPMDRIVSPRQPNAE